MFFVALLAVCGTRLFPALAIFRDFPHDTVPALGSCVPALARMFFVPTFEPGAWLHLGRPPHTLAVGTWEFYAYAGFVSTTLAVFSLRQVRFFHVGLVIGLILMLGATSQWHPSYWIAKVPPFKTMWVVYRWRIMVLATLAFAAGAGTLWILTRASGRRWVRWLVWLAPIEMVVVLLPSWLNHVSPNQDISISRAEVGLPDTEHALSVRQLRKNKPPRVLWYEMTKANVASAYGYEPLFGYWWEFKTRRVYRGHPRYEGEFVVNGSSVQPTRWAPARIEFSSLPAGSALSINLNPGRGWSLNGEPIFSDMRAFEPQKPFVVTVPPSGNVMLTYRPPGLQFGTWVSLCCGVLTLLFLWMTRSAGKLIHSDLGN